MKPKAEPLIVFDLHSDMYFKSLLFDKKIKKRNMLVLLSLDFLYQTIFNMIKPVKKGVICYILKMPQFTPWLRTTLLTVSIFRYIYIKTADGELESIKQFGYEDFRSRL